MQAQNERKTDFVTVRFLARLVALKASSAGKLLTSIPRLKSNWSPLIMADRFPSLEEFGDGEYRHRICGRTTNQCHS